MAQPRPRDAQSAVADYIDKRISLEDMARALNPLLLKISKTVAIRKNVDCDDLAQNTFFTLMKTEFKHYDRERKLHAYLLGVATNIAVHMYKENTKEISESDMGFLARDDDFSLDQIGDLENDYIPMEEEIDRLRGKEAIAKKIAKREKDKKEKEEKIQAGAKITMMKGVSFPDSLKNIPVEVVPEINPDIEDDSRGLNRERVIKEDHQELRRLRKELNLSRDIFAKNIGINKWLLDSYEYGKTLKVPEIVMQKARVFYENTVGTDKELVDLLSSMEMSEILNRWASHLGLNPDKLSECSRALGVNPVTIKRWSQNKARPPMPRLIELDKGVFHDPATINLTDTVRNLDMLIREVPILEGEGAKRVVLSAPAYRRMLNSANGYLKAVNGPDEKNISMTMSMIEGTVGGFKEIQLPDGDWLIGEQPEVITMLKDAAVKWRELAQKRLGKNWRS